jgi:hypothetical protein
VGASPATSAKKKSQEQHQSTYITLWLIYTEAVKFDTVIVIFWPKVPLEEVV